MRFRLLVPIAAVSFCVPFSVRSQAAAKCRAADTRSQALINYLKQLMTATDPKVMDDRDNVYHVPVVTPNKVVLVTDQRTCAKGATAYGESGAATQSNVYIVRLGSSGYAVLDPDQVTNGSETVKVFDRKWKRKGGWTQG